MSLDDDLMFADESDSEDSGHSKAQETWKVMVVDDDEAIHTVTGLVLNNFEFDGRKLEFVHAYSGDEAKTLIGSHPDTAVLLLDVVMETDTAGLDVVKFIRNSLCNTFVRIVLRTGQPGQAPETEIITEYDINDYKDKTELTAQKLHTLLYSCLRSYRDIIALEKNKCTLENVIEASTRIFEEEDISHLESSLVFQVSTLLYAPEDGEIIDPDAKVMCLSLNDNKQMEVKAALGEWGEYQTTTMDTLPEHLLAALEKAQQSHNNVYQERVAGLYFATPAGKEFLVCAEAIEDITAFERDVLEIFCYNTGLALKKTLAPSGGSAGAIDTAHNDEKHAYIDTIGKVVDSHYKVAGSHSSKMSAITKLVAQRVGMEDEAIDNLCDAVGILGLSSLSALPIKPSSDQPQIQQSIEKAIDLFDAETAPAMAVAVSLISQMNENFDGSGLPNHSEKSEISLEARVFRAVNDFYSAGLEQSETAWPISEMIKVLDDAKDQIYAPDVVEEIKTLMADIEAILNQS